MPDRKRLLRVVDLRAGYFKKEILHGLSIEIDSGEVVGLIGANGAGKSTLLKAIIGVIQQRGGKVTGDVVFDNLCITHLEVYKRVARGLSYLPQGGEIFSNLNVHDNLLLATRVADNTLKRAEELVYSLFPDLAHSYKKRAGLLSGGQRQMLAVGIALAQVPRLLLLDEPTAGLEVGAVEAIKRGLENFRREQQSAILLVEQNIGECLDMSDRVYLMSGGQIIDEDLPANIRDNNKLEALFMN
jgi:branched-chain amino acid transport system ATP-binding protein